VWPWLRDAAARLAAELAATGVAAPELRVSTIVTDPWTARR
jgi:hypothetical protein